MRRADALALAALIGVWLLFFWRLFTPNAADQASLVNGDFGGQFVAFGAYQYERLTQGEVPLWNPYNNGGLPFIADTQAAVFYPPRLITIALSSIAGGWSYHALELEMTAHVLAASLLMYGFMRRLLAQYTPNRDTAVLGAFTAAVTLAYGGYLTGYPPLQLAVLEAGIWLPLGMWGILESTYRAEARSDQQIRWGWLAVSGLALGLSWMAGHPQTSWMLTYFLAAYWGFRISRSGMGWRRGLLVFTAGAAIFGLIAGGLAAVQLLPTFEYVGRTSRGALNFDAKGGGFPFRDVIQLLFPNVVSQWSPLYFGVIGLMLAGIALWRGELSDKWFFGAVALLALTASFGERTPIYHLFYNVLPGASFFRGQERGAYLFACCGAGLVGIGMARVGAWDGDTTALRRAAAWIAAVCVIVALITWLGSFALPEAFWFGEQAAFSALIALAGVWLIGWAADRQDHLTALLLAGLIVFELLSVTMDHPGTYAHVPPTQTLNFAPPPLVERALADTDVPFRVDGNYRDLYGNYASLYGLQDIRGISPLFHEGAHTIIQNDQYVNPRAWEVFAVRYVFIDWNELPVQSEVVLTGQDRFGAANLHRLSDPRPFALLMNQTAVVDSPQFAWELLADPLFDPRETIILERPVDVPAVQGGTAQVTAFAPEQITVQMNAPTEAVLSVALVYYPGWEARIDGNPVEILRAYGALSAVVVPAGEHSVTFLYNPLSYRIGAVISLATWIGIAVFGIVMIRRGR